MAKAFPPERPRRAGGSGGILCVGGSVNYGVWQESQARAVPRISPAADSGFS